MQTTREIYLDACAQIGATLAPRAFKYAKSGPHALRAHGDFTFRVSFQSSMRNVAGQSVTPVSLRSAKKRHPGRISAVPCGRLRETGGERKLVSHPLPAAAMAC